MSQTIKSPSSVLEIRVPATVGNMGPGFDVLGLALQLFNNFQVSIADSLSIQISGFGAEMPRDESNLFYRSFIHLYEALGHKAPAIAVKMQLRIPPGSGLGSSATAVVGGLMSANALLGYPLGTSELLPHAIDLELGHHPDNVSPALFGGLVVNVHDGSHVIPLPTPFPPDLRAVLLTPDFAMDTVEGRRLMPPNYSRADVVFNMSRVALFLSALSQRRYDMLEIAMQDKLHQPYRTKLFPLLPEMIQTALDAGACGACLSGGGSSILALATDQLDKIAIALQQKAHAEGIGGRAQVLDIDHEGAQVRWIE